MMEIISGFILIFILINLNAVGYFILNFKENFNKGLSVNLLFGFSTLILFSHFSFFVAGLNSSQIVLIFFLVSLVIFFFTIKFREGFLDNTIKILLISLPVILIYIFLAIVYEEQFYVFRGNKWDWFAFVTSSFYINHLDSLDFLNLRDNFNWENFQNFDFKDHSAYHNNIAIWLLRKVDMYLLGSFFLNLSFNSPFFNLYLFKIFSLVIINVSIVDFVRRYVNIKSGIYIFFLAYIFVTSFWIIYLVEADYYRQLISFGFFIYLLSYLDDFFLDFEKKNYKKIFITIIFIYTLFLIYTELLFIYLIILSISFIFYDKKINFFKDNYKIILLSFFGIVVIFIPSFELISKQIIGQLQSTTGESRWWTYFGAFIFGRSSPALDIQLASEVKNSIYNLNTVSGGMDNVPLKDIIIIITNALEKFGYQSSYFSIIPSISGFYFITDLFKSHEKNIFNIIFLLIFNLYIAFIVTKNLYYVLTTNNNKSKNLKIVIFVFLILSIFFILTGKLWTFIKLYMYMSPVVFLIILFKFSEQNKKLIIKPNIILITIMFCFIFYKYHVFNFGIGKYDSFPSIQKIEMKKNIDWNFEKEKYENCKIVILKFDKWNYYNTNTIPDRFKSIYLTINLLNNNFIFNDNFELLNQSLKQSDKICEVSDL